MEIYKFKSDEIIYAQQYTKEIQRNFSCLNFDENKNPVEVYSPFFNNIKLQYNWFNEKLEAMTLDGWKIVKLNDYVVNRNGIVTVETERNFNILYEK